MILKSFFLVTSSIVALLANSNMPPMPPPMPMVMDAKSKNPPKESESSSMPQECEGVPPMIIFLPPPLEAELHKCKNKLFMPKKDSANELMSKLLKDKVEILKISIVEEFSELYEIEIKTSKNILETYYCNKHITKCFRSFKLFK